MLTISTRRHTRRHGERPSRTWPETNPAEPPSAGHSPMPDDHQPAPLQRLWHAGMRWTADTPATRPAASPKPPAAHPDKRP